MNHLTEEQLVHYHYGDEVDGLDPASIEEHLQACGACQAVIDEIRHTLSTIGDMDVPARGEGYGAEVWARIQPSLDAAPVGWRDHLRSWFAPRRMVLAGGVAVLVMAAFVAGRHAASRPGSPAAEATARPTDAATQAAAADREVVRARSLMVAVGDHLERSQIALVELVNNADGATVDISTEQERARDLVSETRLYRQAALTAGAPGMASVLDDLERVLVEVANSPSTMTGAEFRKVRTRIERQGIIFKIRVFGDRVRDFEDRAVVNAGIRG